MSSVTLGSNVSSLRAQRLLGKSADALAKSSERLASGLRINRPSDDAAGLAIATSLNTSSRIFAQGIRNLNDGISLLSIAEGASHELTGILTRIKELAEQSANGTYSATQRTSLNSEAQALRDEFNRIIQTTEFNDIKVLDGSNTSLQVQAGGNAVRGNELNLGIGAVAFANDGTFRAGVAYSALSVQTVIAGDYNRDGYQDVAATTPGVNTVDIFLGNGDGTFKASLSYNAGGSPQVLKSADLNGDGITDFAIVNSTTPSVSILFGNSNGSFAAPISYAIGAGGSWVSFADFNGDSLLDLVTVNRTDDKISVLLGNGNGTFKAQVTYQTGTNALAVETGDFNADGKVDVVFTDTTEGSVSLMFGNGDGTFKARVTYTSGTTAHGIVVDDINSDGYLDFVATNRGSDSVTAFLNSGTGTFTSASFSAGTDPRTVSSGDINGDGKVDLVVSDNNVGYVAVLMGNDNGTFTAPQTYGSGVNANSTAIADIDGNGTSDIIQGIGSSNGIAIFLGNGIAKLQGFTLKNQADALATLDQMNGAMATLSTRIGQIGAQQSRLQFAASNLSQSRQNYQAAESRISSADIAEESAELVRTQVLQQAAVSVLAQANQLPSLALKLLT